MTSPALPSSGHPRRFEPSFLDDLRARTPLPALVARDVALTRSGHLWRGCCPFHGERTPSFYVYPDHAHCFGCGVHVDAIGYLQHTRRLSFVDAVQELAEDAGMLPRRGERAPRVPLAPMQPPEPDEEPEKAAAAMRIYLEARPSIAGTPVEAYLMGRGIDLRRLGRAPRSLRFHPNLWHRHADARLPAMVASINNAQGDMVAVHRTWLEYAGGGWIKARVPEPKMTLGRYPGGSIRLWRGASRKSLKDAPPGDPVAIGEGIETCLSVVLAVPEIRVLCAVSGGNLGAVELPTQVGPVILMIDNDAERRGVWADKEKDQLKVQKVVNLWLERGFNVRVARSPLGKDFNDALTGG